jgi:hypothetical protein
MVEAAHDDEARARAIAFLRAARAAGARVVFAIADAAGWPRSFYRRAGCAGAGLLPRFLRTAASP